MLQIKRIPHEFQVLPLDLIANDYIPEKVKNSLGYSWFTKDTISLAGEIGCYFNLSYYNEEWHGGVLTDTPSYLFVGDGVHTWWELMYSENGPQVCCAEAIITNNIELKTNKNEKLSKYHYRFLINQLEDSEKLQPCEIAVNSNNQIVIGSPIYTTSHFDNGTYYNTYEMLLQFNGYRYAYKHDTYDNLSKTELAAGEIAYETDTRRLKIGTGIRTADMIETNKYLDLDYISEDNTELASYSLRKNMM